MLASVPPTYSYHWKFKDLSLTHLFFADDVLLFSRGDKQSLTHTMDCLDHFSMLSGLKASVNKINVYFCNCEDSLISWFDFAYGIPHGSLSVKFLRVPLITSKLCIRDCLPLMEKITSRIYSWTNLFLSLAGCVQMIKAVLFAIQAYWSNHFILPRAIHKHLQSIFTRFLWKGDISKKWWARVCWKKVFFTSSWRWIGY